MQPRCFFFYGTLIAGSDNAVAPAIHARLEALGPATVAGALWAIPENGGWYPALVPGAGTVHGQLYRRTAAFAAEDMARIDEWEGFQPAHLDDSLYLRKPEMVTLAGSGRRRAEVYRYNQHLPRDASRITDGDFALWLGMHGHQAWRG